jgi:putative molybdopterin biosynthesis protein
MRNAVTQDQFLDVIDRDEAERRFHAVLDLRPLPPETVPLASALGRVLAADVVAPVDVPSFDRSNVDGFAVRAADTFGATEERTIRLRLNAEELATGVQPQLSVESGSATPIATGGMLPRGADAVVMVEHTECIGLDLQNVGEQGDESVKSGTHTQTSALSHSSDPTHILVRRPVAPGANLTFAGTDIGCGETVLRRGDRLTSRETGVFAALGLARIPVIRRPRVAILSTGNEIIPPGEAMQPGLVYDSNATILADAVRELGGEPVPLGIVPDDAQQLRSKLEEALANDVVLLSGGTSKGAGDISYRVVAELGPPGIIAHGVALKPGKPLCLAAIRKNGKSSTANSTTTIPVAILPGFPTSAIFTFHEFVAPIIRKLAGEPDEPNITVRARLPFRVNSERGRTEYLLVGLVEDDKVTSWQGDKVTNNDAGSVAIAGSPSPRHPVTLSPCQFIAYPMGKGSGSVTTFSCADGFVTIPRQREYLEAGEEVEVRLLGKGLRPAELVVIGSHCVGLDYLLGRLQERGFRSKFLAVGSSGGLAAAERGECDLAGIHLFDPATGTYNKPFLTEGLLLLPGYSRMQGLVFRRGDTRFEGRAVTDAVAAALKDPNCILVNRNRGSGTRVLIDGLLGIVRPPGYPMEARSHNAVAAAVAQGRADWGVCIAGVARDTGLGFSPLKEEQYDFVVPSSRWDRPPVRTFRTVLESPETRNALAAKGLVTAAH